MDDAAATRAEEIFYSALELSGNERDQWVASQCGLDADLRRLLGRYRLIERIGEGGMGVVWRAEQIAGVRRTVAVKVIKGGFASAEALAHFDIERHVAAAVAPHS